MANQAVPPLQATEKARRLTCRGRRTKKRGPAQLAIHLTSHAVEDENSQRQAELFYLQKQIQAQTPMVIVLEDGEMVEGCIEWYDRNSLKVRGRGKTLIYKSAIKYMYKVGDTGK